MPSQAEGDQYAFFLLCILPLCGSKLISDWSEGLESILSNISRYMDSRQPLFETGQDGAPGICAVLDDTEAEEDDEMGEESETVIKASDTLTEYWEYANKLRASMVAKEDLSGDTIESPMNWIWTQMSEELEDVEPVSACQSTRLESNDSKMDGGAEDTGEAPGSLPVPAPFASGIPAWRSTKKPGDCLVRPVMQIFTQRVRQASALLALSPSKRLVLKDACMDVLYAFCPIISWQGITTVCV